MRKLATAMIARIERITTSMLEKVNLVLQVVAIGLLFFGFAFGTATIVVGIILSKRQGVELAQARTEAAEANERSVKFEIDLEQQKEATAVAQRALLDLQSKLRDRTLDEVSRKIMLEALSIGQHERPVKISFISSPAEPSNFAKELAAVLREAGWTVSDLDGGFALGSPPIGTIVRIPERPEPENPNPWDQAITLAQALSLANHQTPVVRSAIVRNPKGIELVVGLKP